MTISEALLPEFDQETANTRKTLERVPEDKFGWKPHDKSGTMGWLASHIANLPQWATMTVAQDSFEMMPPGQAPPRTPQAVSTQELLETFDRNVSAAREAIAGTADEKWTQNWTLLAAGNPVFSLPRTTVIRTFVMNHIIHHRAQLTVYLRLNDVAVPALYGPSADER